MLNKEFVAKHFQTSALQPNSNNNKMSGILTADRNVRTTAHILYRTWKDLQNCSSAEPKLYW